MCKLKSAIILKDRVFIPDYDHHSEMLAELGIADTRANAERLFVRAELIPKNGDVFSDIDTWEFNVDQDIRPEWFVESYEKERMVNAVKEWAKSRIHVGVDGLKIDSGKNHYIKDCKKVVICGSASIGRVCGSASISEVCGSASISYVYDSASIGRVCGSASISYVCGSASIGRVCGSASIGEVCGSASISYVYDSAIVSGSPYGWDNGSKMILSENATFKDNHAKIIYQSGNWELRLVGKDKK
jgi:hypothetical protein